MEEKLLSKINFALAQAERSKFYKQRKIPVTISNIEEFQKINFTEKKDLKKSDPFDLLSVEIDDIQQYHESSGTTGESVSVWYSRKDMQEAARQLRDKDIKITKKDIALIRFPYALSVPAHIFTGMLIDDGATIIPVSRGSMVTPYQRVINIMKKINATILVCNPSEAVVLADVAQHLGFDSRKDFSVRMILVAGEMLCDGRKMQIEKLWEAKVFNFYGMTETANIAVSCAYGNLHISSDYYLEIVKIDDRKAIINTGKGLLAVTQLNKEAFPLIRYQTEDIVEIKQEKCQCGNQMPMLIHHGRFADAICNREKCISMLDIQNQIYGNEKLNPKYFRLIFQGGILTIIVEQEEYMNIVKCKEIDLPISNEVKYVSKHQIEPINELLKITKLRKANYYIKNANEKESD
ncbi:MAG: AMP-binding protein [Lachnospiraceae bacterium]|nr:AMP-binding protein [Lachnospiraceae bacterium]